MIVGLRQGRRNPRRIDTADPVPESVQVDVSRRNPRERHMEPEWADMIA